MTGLAAAVGVIAALLVVLALLALVLYGARALLGARPVAGDGELAVVRRIAVGPKQGVAVIKVGDRALLISVGDGGVRTLAELPAEAAVAETPARVIRQQATTAALAARWEEHANRIEILSSCAVLLLVDLGTILCGTGPYILNRPSTARFKTHFAMRVRGAPRTPSRTALPTPCRYGPATRPVPAPRSPDSR